MSGSVQIKDTSSGDSNPTIFLKTQHYDRPGSLTNEAVRPAESTLTEKPKLAP